MPEPPALPSDADQEIRTARLHMVPMCRGHAADMYPLLADSRLYEFTGDDPPDSAEALEETYAFRESRRSPDGEQLWLNWLMQDENACVGYVQATVHATHAFVAWVVGTQWQGQGYASEAAAAVVQWLAVRGVRDVRACVNPAHAASQGVARNAGLDLTTEMVDGEEVWATPGR